jgi:hypothetical protein
MHAVHVADKYYIFLLKRIANSRKQIMTRAEIKAIWILITLHWHDPLSVSCLAIWTTVSLNINHWLQQPRATRPGSDHNLIDCYIMHLHNTTTWAAPSTDNLCRASTFLMDSNLVYVHLLQHHWSSTRVAWSSSRSTNTLMLS